MTDKNDVFTGEDLDGNIVRFYVKTPGVEELKKSQTVYNKAFRKALDEGALLRQKLSSYMVEQDLWDDAKQKEYEDLMEEISNDEDSLKAGGIRLSQAKEIAVTLREKREKFRNLLSERNALDQASAEGQADNARFAELVRLCTMNPETNKPWFNREEDYDASASQPWVVNAAEKLGGLLYGLDPNYEKNLEENKFLKEFHFVNEDLTFINEDGHTIDEDGRLINDEGRYIAYENDEDYKAKRDPYFVNRDGERVEKVNDEWVKASVVERKPFLDDDDQPIATDEPTQEITEEEVKPKRRTRNTKKDVNQT